MNKGLKCELGPLVISSVLCGRHVCEVVGTVARDEAGALKAAQCPRS